MAIAEIKWKLVKDTYFFDTTTCYLSENGNHLFYSGNEKRIEILIDDLNELVRKGCAMWLELGEYEFGLDKLSKCPTTTWYSIHQMLYSLEPWGVMKESKKSARKSLKEAKNGYYIYTKLDNKYAYCDKSKFTEEGFYLIEDYMLDAIHIFETEKEAEKFIDEDLNRFMVKKDNVVIDEYPSTKGGFFESKKSSRKSIREGRKVDTFIIYYEERNGETEGFEVYGVQQLKDSLKWLRSDKMDVVKITVYKRGKNFNNDHNDVTEYYFWKESKKSVRKSIKESRQSILDKRFYELVDEGYIYDEDEDGMNMSYGELVAVSDDLWETLEDELKYYDDFQEAYDVYMDIMDNTSDDAKMFMTGLDEYFYFDINEDEGTYSVDGEIPFILEKLFKKFQKETDFERV